MKNLFFMGGPLIMGMLTAILIIMVAWAIYHFLPVFANKEFDAAKTAARLKYVKTIGTFAMVVGIFGQLYGLYQAFVIIERMGDVSQSLLAGGLKVSLIPTLYGITIFLISLLIWFVLDFIVSRKNG